MMTSTTPLQSLAGRWAGAVVTFSCFALVATSGCGFFASAGEIPLSAEQGIPRIQQEILFPNVDELTGGDLNDKIGAVDPETGKPLISGVPTSLKKTTLAHIQGLLALAGKCRNTIKIDDLSGGAGEGDEKKADAAATGPVSDIEVSITNCTGDPRCTFLCGDWQGIRLDAGATIQILSEAQAKELAAQLAKAGGTKTAAAALVAIRLLIYQLDLFQAADAANKDDASRCNKVTTTGNIEAHRHCTTQLLDNFELVLQDAHLAEGQTKRNEVPVITFQHLNGIDAKSPKRFEVDGDDPVTARIKELVVAKKKTEVRVVQRLFVRRPDLFEMNFDGGGLIIDLQPEVLVSVTEVIKELGGVK